MKSGWKLHLASWIGALGVALFVSSAGHAATFTFDGNSLITPQDTGILTTTGGQTNAIIAQPSFSLLGDGTFDITITFTNESLDDGDIDSPGLRLDGTLNALVNPLILTGLSSPSSFIVDLLGTTVGTSATHYNFKITADAVFHPRVAQTPVPAAALLFGSGLAVLGAAGRKKRKKATQA